MVYTERFILQNMFDKSVRLVYYTSHHTLLNYYHFIKHRIHVYKLSSWFLFHFHYFKGRQGASLIILRSFLY